MLLLVYRCGNVEYFCLILDVYVYFVLEGFNGVMVFIDNGWNLNFFNVKVKKENVYS